MLHRFAVAVLAAAFVVPATAGVAKAQGGGKTTLKLATLAPPRSPWGKVFKVMSKAVEKRTDGKVEIVWLWNGTAGPERAVVGKIRSGQITGGAITAVGLADIHKPILALQMPGVFNSWAELDRARDMLKPEFEAHLKNAGFYTGGFGDVGVARVMSKGFMVRVPADLRGKHPAMIKEDLIAPKIYEAIGGVTGVPGDVTSFLPKLSSGSINVMNTPPLAAEQLQWASRLDHMNLNPTAYGMGAMVMSQKELDKLSADQRDIVKEVGKQANEALRKSIRKEDDAAFERLKGKMKTHSPTEAEKAEWKKIFNEACRRLKSALPGDVLGKIKAC